MNLITFAILCVFDAWIWLHNLHITMTKESAMTVTFHDTPLSRRLFFRDWCAAMRRQYAELYAAGVIDLAA